MNKGKTFATLEGVSVASLFKEQFSLYDSKIKLYNEEIDSNVNNKQKLSEILVKLGNEETLYNLMPTSVELLKNKITLYYTKK